MAVTAKLFGPFPLNALGSGSAGGSSIDYLSDTINVQLHTNAYTPSQAHSILSDVSSEVANGSGYTTGGATLGTKTLAYSSLVTTADAADTSWTSLTKTHRYAIIVDTTPTTPLKPLIGYVDTGGDQSNAGTDLTYQWNASGIFTFTVA